MDGTLLRNKQNEDEWKWKRENFTSIIVEMKHCYAVTEREPVHFFFFFHFYYHYFCHRGWKSLLFMQYETLHFSHFLSIVWNSKCWQHMMCMKIINWDWKFSLQRQSIVCLLTTNIKMQHQLWFEYSFRCIIEKRKKKYVWKSAFFLAYSTSLLARAVAAIISSLKTGKYTQSK